MKKVLYPGSFDPITKGHMNVIAQAQDLFDEIVIAVMSNPSKKVPFFTVEERVNLIKDIYKHNKKIKVISAAGATVDIAISNNANAILRGLRGMTDFDYEIQLSAINNKLSDNKVHTICLFPDEKCQYISSSVVKELYSLQKDVNDYVHPIVKQKMLDKIKV